jgi:CheY-like chemotaxis protein
MAKILIADDRQLMRSALKTIFAMRPKWEICGEATDGLEVVTKVSESQPDLILMDFKMPLADGIQAAKKGHFHLRCLGNHRILAGLASQGDESSAENWKGFINAQAITSSFVYLTNSFSWKEL